MKFMVVASVLAVATVTFFALTNTVKADADIITDICIIAADKETLYVDDQCVMLKSVRLLLLLGLKDAAIARICMDEDNRKAIQLSGYECPQEKVEQKGKKDTLFNNTI